MGGLLAGLIAITIAFLLKKIAKAFNLPDWITKSLFVLICFYGAYELAQYAVPEYNKPIGVWVAAVGASSGIIMIGLLYLNEEGNDKNRQKGKP